MQDAGFVNVREGNEIREVPVTSINYAFQTKEGAENNRNHIGGDATIWYVDENGELQLLDGET
jgi:hypothetical protein